MGHIHNQITLSFFFCVCVQKSIAVTDNGKEICIESDVGGILTNNDENSKTSTESKMIEVIFKGNV